MEATIEEQLIARVRSLSPTQQQQILTQLQKAAPPQTGTPPGVPGTAWKQFAGSISPEDLGLMEQAIEEGCEKVDADGW